MRASLPALVIAWAIWAICALGPDAAANGRPPATNGVIVQPADPRSLLVRATFGLLVTRDGGCSYRWVCEQAIGYGGQFDPKYAVAADGTIFATTFTGLRVSRDGGCTWRTATEERPAGDPGRVADIWVDALELSPGPGGDVWIATAESGRPNDVFRSTDGGTTFEPRNLRSPTIWWKSVKVAPSRPARVYVTGYQVAGPPRPGEPAQGPRAHLRWSDDAGAHWTASALDGVRVGATPIIYAAAVDPENAEVVLVTSAGASAPGDRLYRSTDGGATLREVLATRAAITGVIFDGTAPGAAVLVSTIAGAFRSTDGGATFAPLPDPPQLGCLGARGDALLGCASNWQPDAKALARSIDGGATWQKLLRFEELAGPLACGPGTTVQEKCAPLWPGLQRQLGATPPAGCPAPVIPPPPPPPPAPPPRSPERRGGCCDSGGGDSGPLGAVALAGFACLARARRLRTRRPARYPRQP